MPQSLEGRFCIGCEGGIITACARRGNRRSKSADSEGWEVVFECEEEGQSVKTTYHEGYSTRFEDGKPYVQGDVGFEFGTSGNVYHVTVNVEPCPDSNTGYCITVEAMGDTLGNEPVTCQNY